MTETTDNNAISYELLLIIAGSLRDAEKKKEVTKWEEEVAKFAKVLNKAVWENRDLAYRIQKEETGTYLIVNFESEGEHIAELENSLRLDPKVIRHLIYKTPKHYEWREYSDEDLEHDFTKLDSMQEEKMEKRFTKKKPAAKRAAKPVAKKPAAGKEIDKKLDDILADL